MVSCPFNQLAGWAAASLAGWRAGLLAPPPPHPPPTSSSPAHCGCELYYRTSVARCGCAPVARLGCSVTSLPLPPPRMYRFTANVSANVDILLGPTAATTGQQAAEPALEVRVHTGRKVCPRPVAAPPARGTGAGRGTIATTCERFNCERFHCDRPAAPSRPAPRASGVAHRSDGVPARREYLAPRQRQDYLALETGLRLLRFLQHSLGSRRHSAAHVQPARGCARLDQEP